MAEINITEFTDKHYIACSKIWGDEPMFQRYGASEERASEIIREELNDPRNRIYAAEIDGQFAGMITVVLNGFFTLGTYIKYLMTSPDHQRKGVGRALLAFVEKEHLGRKGMGLLVNAENASAIQLYEKLGYKKVGKIDEFIRPSENELILYKSV